MWVGFYNEQKPGPLELAREDALPGHAVTLGDGQQWVIPVARGIADLGDELIPYIALPRRSQLNDAGEWAPGPVVSGDAELWAIAERWIAETSLAMAKEEGVKGSRDQGIKMTFASLHTDAVTALGRNYRVGAVEADMLELLSQERCAEMLGALCDLPTLRKFADKKKAAAGAG